jgi:Lamin Tail Domain/CHU_C Type IX secretion signal domain
MKKICLLLVLLPFTLVGQNRYDIVISEIMADPSPQVGLPANEWLELRNTTNGPVNLQNWRIGDASGQSGPMPSFILQPDSCVIICTASAVNAMMVFGTAMTVTSFPSLDNDSDQLFLKASNGKIIHAVPYELSWYGNALKMDGGWTLEMIDTKNPCAGQRNWKASTHTSGGTPGKKNSVDAVVTDMDLPGLQRAYTSDSVTIILVFDEPVDSLSGATLANYAIDGTISFVSAMTIAPLFNTVQLKTIGPLAPNAVYSITATSVKDCKGNSIGSSNKVRVGLPSDALAGEWVINEILFDPRPNGSDYVEFFNNSNKILDASKLHIATRNSSGGLNSVKTISPVPFYVFPGEYIVVTEDAHNLSLQYLVKLPGSVFGIASLPPFPDNEGIVITLNAQGVVIDEVKYKDDWHFKLIDNPEGISLERIDPAGITQQPTNWHSAASTAGYGTPTYINSQFKSLQNIQAVFEVSPKLFSPDNDGRDDIASIHYTMNERGYVANISIYDGSGRTVRYLVQNGTLGSKGYWNWDGLNDKGEKLPVGIYIVLAEMFNLEGRKQQFKATVVLARKL